MFAKALTISLLLHLLLFALSGTGFLSSFFCPPTVRPPQPLRQIITMVEPSVPTARAEDGLLASTELPLESKTNNQSLFLEELKPERVTNSPNVETLNDKKEKGLVNPAPKPAQSLLSPAETNKVVPLEETVENSAEARKQEEPVIPPLTTKPVLLSEADAKQVLTPTNIAPTSSTQETMPTPENNAANGLKEIGETVAQQEPLKTVNTSLPAAEGDSSTKSLNDHPGAEYDTLPHVPVSAAPTELENTPPTGPIKVFHPAPAYPRQARRRGWEGTVYLEAEIDQEGKVAELNITTSSGYELLDQAARKAVAQWRYEWPLGQPTSSNENIITIKISFQLEE